MPWALISAHPTMFLIHFKPMTSLYFSYFTCAVPSPISESSYLEFPLHEILLPRSSHGWIISSCSESVKMLVVQSCLTLHNPMDCTREAPRSMGFSRHNTGVGSHFFPQRTFPTQRSNLDLLHCRKILYHLSHQGRPSTCRSSLNCDLLKETFVYDPIKWSFSLFRISLITFLSHVTQSGIILFINVFFFSFICENQENQEPILFVTTFPAFYIVPDK